MFKVIWVILLASSVNIGGRSSNVCQITDEQIGGVRLGASLVEVSDLLRQAYSMEERHDSDSAPSLVARSKAGGRSGDLAFIVWFNAGRAFMIDSYRPCATAEGVGPGGNLGLARAVYRAGAELFSTDLGYFVSFAQRRRILFLLRDSDIPKLLRGLHDDELTPSIEKRILALKTARIAAVRIVEE